MDSDRSPARFRRPVSESSGPIRTGFTLIELLVVIGILLLLTVIAAFTVNFVRSGDAVPHAARQVQSYLEGARDRAIFAGQPRGVRFLLEDRSGTGVAEAPVVTGLIYIGEPKLTVIHFLQYVDPTPLDSSNNDAFFRNLGWRTDNDVTDVSDPANHTNVDGVDQTDFESIKHLSDIGLVGEFSELKIANTAGNDIEDGSRTYHIDQNPDFDTERFQVTDPVSFNNGDIVQAQFVTASAPLSGQDVTTLPEGTVIDLDSSRLPGVWQQGGNYSRFMDIMFTPSGNVIGPVASSGLVHFVVASRIDVDNRTLAGGPELGSLDIEGDDAIVTVFTRTGNITTSDVYPDTNDPYRFAETGEGSLK